jgi:hypothetical protein
VASGDGAVAVGGNVAGSVLTGPVFGASWMPLRMALKDPQTVFDAVDIETFTGREWLDQLVRAFFSSRKCGYVWLEADAGLGKTAFAGWLVKAYGYISHFARYGGGDRTRVALQNLSAQLIDRYSLEELELPTGALPPGADTPEGFDSLLSAAARHARKAGEQLVVVVDGLDEAQREDSGLPWGLPSTLPPGVFVVGTYRTGMPRPLVESPALLLRIRTDDPRNRADVDAYLSRMLAEDALAARLAADGVSAEQLAEQLAHRCGGIWVYLRYVLEELRLGLRHPTDLDDLPESLSEYYFRQVMRWSESPDWSRLRLPALGVLAVAREPLTPDLLALLVGADAEDVRPLCHLYYRPFLARTKTTPRAYAIYHASLVEFLTGSRASSHADAGGEDRERIADALHAAAAAAHSRIADYYLDQFGGLDSGLERLAGDPHAAGVDDSYPLRHLAYHLQAAGRAQDLHRLLAAECAAAERSVNVWYTAHDQADTIDDYLADLAAGLYEAEQATDHALAHGRTASTIGLEMRYVLITASIYSLTSNISIDLLAQLVDQQLWTPARALAHARRFPEPEERCRALLALSSRLPVEDRPGTLGAALEAATAITSEPDRARTLAGLAPHLPPDLLATAVEAATAVHSEQGRSSALTGLGPHLSAELLATALRAAFVISDGSSRAAALTGLAPHLPAGLLAAALEAGMAITSEPDRARALAGLAPHLPGDFLATALEAATVINNEFDRAKALAGLAPYLPAEDRARAVRYALGTASAISWKPERALALACLAPLARSDARPAALAAALASAIAVEYGDDRAEALTSLAPHLPPDLLATALHSAIAIDREKYRARALTGLAPHLPPDLLATALEAATAISEEYDRKSALTGMAPHLPADLLATALEAATTFEFDGWNAFALRELAPHLTSDLAATALSAIKAMPEHFRPIALAGLAPHLPAHLMASALEDAITGEYGQDGALASLAAYLPPDLCATALDAAMANGSEPDRAAVLTALAPRLPAEDRPGAVAAALAVALAIGDKPARAQALAGLVPYLPADELPTSALDAALAITEAFNRAPALTALVPYLPAEDRPGVLAMATDAATAITDEISRASALGALVQYLPAEDRPAAVATALAAATASPAEEFTRALALAALAPRLPADLLATALDAALAITDRPDRALALAALAPRLPGDLLATALDAALAIADTSHRAEVLASLAPRLPPDLVRTVLDDALSISYEPSRAEALASLALYLPAEDRPNALAAALKALPATSNEERTRTRVLASLAPLLPADLLPAALGNAATLSSSPEISPFLNERSNRTQALASLAPNLPTGLLVLALTAAGTDSNASAAVLTAAESAYLNASGGSLIDLYRRAFTSDSRTTSLEIIGKSAPIIARLGGAEAVSWCTDAIASVCRWWP